MGSCYKVHKVQLGALWWSRGVGKEWDEKEVQEGGDVGMHMAGSLHCTTETNTRL